MPVGRGRPDRSRDGRRRADMTEDRPEGQAALAGVARQLIGPIEHRTGALCPGGRNRSPRLHQLAARAGALLAEPTHDKAQFEKLLPSPPACSGCSSGPRCGSKIGILAGPGSPTQRSLTASSYLPAPSRPTSTVPIRNSASPAATNRDLTADVAELLTS